MNLSHSEYLYRRDRGGTYSVWLCSSLTGDAKECVQADLTERQAQRLAQRMNRQREGKYGGNPPLTVFAPNPPMRLYGRTREGMALTIRRVGDISHNVHSIRYTHRQDGKDYQHDFNLEEVSAIAVRLGSHGKHAVLLVSEQDIWDDYPDTMGDYD